MQLNPSEFARLVMGHCQIPDNVDEVTGNVDLTRLERAELCLRDLTIKGNLLLSQAVVKQLELRNVTVEGEIVAARMQIEGLILFDHLTTTSLFLHDLRANGLRIQDSVVNGTLSFTEAKIEVGFDITGCRIEGNLDCSKSLVAQPARCSATSIGGSLSIDEAIFENSLEITGTTIQKDFSLYHASIAGELNLLGTTVADKLELLALAGPESIRIEKERARALHMAAPRVPIVAAGLLGYLPEGITTYD